MSQRGHKADMGFVDMSCLSKSKPSSHKLYTESMTLHYSTDQQPQLDCDGN